MGLSQKRKPQPCQVLTDAVEIQKITNDARIASKDSPLYAKRIALVLRGQSYNEGFQHWTGQQYALDWRLAMPSMRTNVLPYCQDVYIHSNIHHLQKELIEDFRPVHHSFENHNINVYRSIALRVRLCLQEMEICAEKYDWVVVTRFDGIFDYPITELPVADNKFNVLCHAERLDLIDDNLWIFPSSMIPNVIKVLDAIFSNKIKSTHEIFTSLNVVIGHGNVNIMFPGHYLIVNHRPYITFVRELDQFHSSVISSSNCSRLSDIS